MIACFKGFSKGFVVGIFSLFAFIIGLAAALKLSAAVADYLQTHVVNHSRWLPLISFLLVFFAVVLLVSFGAKLIRQVVRIATLGWLDRIGGIILYVILYTFIFSIILFYAEKMLLVKRDVLEASYSYPFISPWGPKIIDNLGKIIPLFEGLFTELQKFFESFTEKPVAAI